MTRLFQPMLASADLKGDLNLLHEERLFPVWGSYKIDGIRAVCRGGELVSRTLKPIRSAYAQQAFAKPVWEHFDGELVVVDIPEGDTLYHASESAVMTNGSQVPLKWLVFDHVEYPDWPYAKRFTLFHGLHKEFKEQGAGIEVLEQRVLHCPRDVEIMEQEALDAGHEGLIVRVPNGHYKYGRSTLKQGWLIKVVRVLRSEARIIGMEEMMHNDNAATIDARGYTKRTVNQENLRPSGILGAFYVEDVHDGKRFKIGTGEGLDMALRKEIWNNIPLYDGRIVRYRYKPCGTKDLPRQPIWEGFRSTEDM